MHTTLHRVIAGKWRVRRDRGELHISILPSRNAAVV
jgi:hypothetical protein